MDESIKAILIVFGFIAIPCVVAWVAQLAGADPRDRK